MLLLYFLFKHKEAFYKEEEDFINIYSIAIFSLLYAFLFHDDEFEWMTHQSFITFSTVIEALAIIPQRRMIKRDGDLGGLITIYTLSLMMARFLRLFFWIVMAWNEDFYFSLMVADLFHSIVLMKFGYEYYLTRGTGSSYLVK